MNRDILLETIQEDAAEVFSISEIAQASADTFQPLAEADGKSLTAEIRIRGVQENFFRLFSILLDNAVKYCDPGEQSSCPYPYGDGISVSPSPTPAQGLTQPSSPATLTASTGQTPPAPDPPEVTASACLP